MEYTLDCSLERQDNLVQEEGNTGVKYMRDRELATGETHQGEGAINTPEGQDQVGTRQTGNSKQEQIYKLTLTDGHLILADPDSITI